MVPRRYGEFLDLLPATTRSIIERPPLAISWLPLEHFPLIINAALQVLDGNLTRLSELAELSLKADLSTLYRIFIRMASPEMVLERAPAVWATYLSGGGAIQVTERAPRSRTMTYADVPFPSTAYWAYQRGALVGGVHASGATKAEAKIIEGGTNSARCVIRVSW